MEMIQRHEIQRWEEWLSHLGFVSAAHQERRSSTQMEEKHQPHLCIKTETGHKGVISRLQIIVPPFFIMLMLSSDSKRFPSGLLSLGLFWEISLPLPALCCIAGLLCDGPQRHHIIASSFLIPHPSMSNLDKVHNFCTSSFSLHFYHQPIKHHLL